MVSEREREVLRDTLSIYKRWREGVVESRVAREDLRLDLPRR